MNNADIIGLPETSIVAELARSSRVGFGDTTRVLRKFSQLPQSQWESLLVWLVDERKRVTNGRDPR